MEFKILDSIPDLTTIKSFTDRYFAKRYVLDVSNIENNDIMIMFHSNKIALLSLAPSHFFFKKEGEFKINFHVGKFDRLSNAVKGKSKKGGQHLKPQSVICRVEYKDETSFDIPACMQGTLIEVNEELTEHPELLKQKPDSNGYIALILSSIAISEKTKEQMLSHEEYLKVLQSRCSDGKE